MTTLNKEALLGAMAKAFIDFPVTFTAQNFTDELFCENVNNAMGAVLRALAEALPDTGFIYQNADLYRQLKEFARE